MPKVKKSITAAKFHNTRNWLIKGEGQSRIEKGKDVKFTIDDLEMVKRSSWDGVRNYEARNIMRDCMKIGDLCFFYHSNCQIPGISGIARVIKEGYPDHTAFDPSEPYYDPKSDSENPIWYMVDAEFVRRLKQFIPLKELQSYKDSELKGGFLFSQSRTSK